MSGSARTLAVIPARGGSKGLPGKNTKSFAGIPLIAHSILFSRMCSEITRCVVSTDAVEIADSARAYGAEVPFVRPADLAQDASPIFPVLRHALLFMEELERNNYDYVALLDPTSPAREPNDMAGALSHLRNISEADGVVTVSEPDFNPIWHCVIEQDGWMKDLIPEGTKFTRRQAVPRVFRINGALYIWRSAFVRSASDSWRAGRHLTYEIPESRAMSIDSLEEFQRAESLVRSGLIRLPWIS